MKAAVLRGVKDIVIEERESPVPEKGEVLFKTRASGICNSDIARYAEGKVYHFPVVLGHEFAGEVADAHGSLGWKKGDRVAVYPLLYCGKCPYCRLGQYNVCMDYDYFGSRRDGAFSEYLAVSEKNLVLIPDGVSFEEASMLEPAAVALNAVKKGSEGQIRSACVMGAGPIGLVIAQWMRSKGAENVILVDIDGAKIDFAREMGFDKLVNPRKEDFEKRIMELAGGDGADVCFEATGHPSGLNNLIKAVRRKGTMVLIGNPVSDMNIEMKLYSSVLRKELTIKSVWNSSFPEDWKDTLEAVDEKRIDLKRLISHRYSLEQLKDALEMMVEGRTFRNKVIIVFGGRDEGSGT